ncbi:MAG TPA: NrfD/PsrC family molybdoenzyme membrane anchor subunit [Candidatus Binatia bacterium]
MSLHFDEFLIDVKPQKEWGWLVITYLFFGGAGAGLFLASLYIGHPWAEGLGLLLLLIGTLFLLLDLGRPERFWRAFFRARTSWISRGCYFITALMVLGSLDLLLQFTAGDSGAVWAVKAGAAVAAVAVMIYTGFVLSPSPAIPFWNSTFFPVIFFAYSLLAGIDFLILASPVLPPPVIDVARLEKVQFGLVLLCLLMVMSHLSVMSGSAIAARKSIQLLTHGKWGALFLGGVIGVGLVLPLLLAWPSLWQPSFQTMFAITAVLALLRLFGDYLFRFLVIRAGLYDPLL